MAPLRLRHPKGVSTLDISWDSGFTIQDLQQKIYALTDILPSRQILKCGYPPRPLTLVPELPIESLGLQRGEQLIVTEDTSKPVASQSRVQPQASSIHQQATSPIFQHKSASASPSGPDSVEVDGSFLVHRIVPDDNSCLFSSAALVFEQSITKAPQMRKLVVEGIRNNPYTYSEAILGMPPTQYLATISKSTSWGGAIELSVLAAHYSTEIASIDVETGRIDHFSPGEHITATNRAILIYSGIHYDAASLAPVPDAPDDWHQTIFPIRSSEDNSDSILIAAKKLADILRTKKAFTNTATFDLKCEQCGQGLKGEKGARAHAEQTGHVRFGEY
ncbi:OTU-domain-containing protein [Gymnopilus junonius]|uniref:Ubiquitin thioesterase OTU n=1 Tax=Gymnopilus junonius TaxID=109634 RepID=A0A9P5P174_GYMJU|nr:OTU-domain-containing protein [Gymnopilus junonius]